MGDYKSEGRKCLFCGASLSGRKDKKYCDDNCRNNHHYNLNRDINLFVNSVNNVLLHNRLVLKSLCQKTKIIVRKQKLKDAGFDFNYITAYHPTKGNDCYRLVYDYAYKIIGEDVVVIKY